MAKKPLNVILFGIDSLWAAHMSSYGYDRLTTPHIDRFAQGGILFEQTFSPHIPTTPAYASMLTGTDVFTNEVVALRHKGQLTERVDTLAEILGKAGYESTCVGFSGNPSSRGFDNYIDYGGWAIDEHGRSPKAESLNDVTIPELERLAAGDKPFFLFMRHMDPHSPYLPPKPFDRMFHSSDECDPSIDTMRPVFDFKPFATYFKSWIPENITDADYVIAQYDGAIAYMDACIQRLFTRIEELGLADNTLIVINSDHGETLMDHDCYFDHHGMYDCTLHVPLIMRLPGRLPEGKRVSGINLHQDLVPTIVELAGIDTDSHFDGKSLLPLINGERSSNYSGFYITEATWMRKHGWRTPEWKLMIALEPDFHFKPEIELYNLVLDPEENNNVAEENPDVVDALRKQMDAWISKREQETGVTNPIETNLQWHGKDHGPFESSEQAYDGLFIGDVIQAKTLQDKKK